MELRPILRPPGGDLLVDLADLLPLAFGWETARNGVHWLDVLEPSRG
jgi:hypothetical protein